MIILNAVVKKELTDIIVEHVLKTFQTMFGVNVIRTLNSNISFNEDDLVSMVALHQNGTDIIIRFAFPRNLISPLLTKIYDPVMAMHESVVEDAACEIANIVCSGLKSTLNQNGYQLEMQIPKICHSMYKKNGEDNTDCLDLDFVLEDRGFSVDLNMKDLERKAGGDK